MFLSGLNPGTLGDQTLCLPTPSADLAGDVEDVLAAQGDAVARLQRERHLSRVQMFSVRPRFARIVVGPRSLDRLQDYVRV